MQESKANPTAASNKSPDMSALSAPKTDSAPRFPIAKTKDSNNPTNVDNSDDLSPASVQLANGKSTGGTSQGGKAEAAANEGHPTSQQSPRSVVFYKHKQLFQLMNRSVNECKFCHPPYNDTNKVIYDGVYRKYESTTQKTYNTNIINDIIFNSNTHIVSIFKDYLIIDDTTEFLKRHYTEKEQKERLNKLCVFYNKYSKVFPNYISLEEKKYMFKNIERKQKMIDEKHSALKKADTKERDDDEQDPNQAKLFTTKFMSQLSVAHSRVQPTVVKKMNIEQLIDKFIENDSMSMISVTHCEGIDATFIKPEPALKQTRNLRIETKGLFLKAESARKKSIVAHAAVASTRSHKGLGPTRPFAGIVTPTMLPTTTLMNVKIHKPSPLSAGGVRELTGRASSRAKNSPLNININLNVVWDKEKSRLETPQSCTAAGMCRYRSLGRFRDNDSLKPKQLVLPAHHPVRPAAYHGSTLRSRQTIARQADLQRVYSNPSLRSGPSPGPRENRRRVEPVGTGEIYRALSPTSLRVHSKSKSTVPPRFVQSEKKYVVGSGAPRCIRAGVEKSRTRAFVIPLCNPYRKKSLSNRKEYQI